jgi:hypothetical protein
MQPPWDEHFDEIVIPAWQAYLAAEGRLTDAINAKNENASKRAGYDALREGGAATIYVHHFADVVMRARPDWLPDMLRSPRELRRWVSGYCTMLRADRQVTDVELCGDVADILRRPIQVPALRDGDGAIVQGIFQVPSHERQHAGLVATPANIPNILENRL